MIGRVRGERPLRNDDLVVVFELLGRDVERKPGAVRPIQFGRTVLDPLSGRVHDHDRVAVRAGGAGGDRARRLLSAPRGRDVRLQVRGRAYEFDRTESEVIDDVAHVVLPAVQLRVAPADVDCIGMHQAEAVVGRVPKLTDPAKLRAARRDLAHKRGCPTLRDQPIAR